MTKKLYVGNLPFQINEDALKQAFSQAGTVVAVNIITDKYSGRPKGFGFVEMASDEDAQAAIEMWNGKDLEGRTLKVDEARPMERRDGAVADAPSESAPESMEEAAPTDEQSGGQAPTEETPVADEMSTPPQEETPASDAPTDDATNTPVADDTTDEGQVEESDQE